MLNWVKKTFGMGDNAGKNKPRVLTYVLQSSEAETVQKIAQDKGVSLEELGKTESVSEEVSGASGFHQGLVTTLANVRNEIVPSLQWNYSLNQPDSSDVRLTVTWDPTTPPASPSSLQTEEARRDVTDLHAQWRIETKIAQLMQEYGVEVSGLRLFEEAESRGRAV